jgi:hypothetical protein
VNRHVLGLGVAGTALILAMSAGVAAGIGDLAHRETCTVRRAEPADPIVAVIDSGLSPAAGLATVVDARSQSVVEGAELHADESGHGTAMAAIVHRRAPTASLLVLRALDGRARADPSSVATAVRAASDDHADVINLSLEGIVTDPDVVAAIDAATRSGAVVVVAAGNEGRDLAGHPGWEQLAGIDGVVVIAAADDDGVLAARTSWGHGVVDLAAPGLEVPTIDRHGGPTTVSGSSPAAATVSGALAAAIADGSPAGSCSPLEVIHQRTTAGHGIDGRVAHGFLPSPDPPTT